MIIDFSDYSANQRYHVMTQTIIPRPIAWVLTDSNTDESSSKNLNLAPFSYFTAVSSEPAILMLSIGKKPNGDLKDTTVNALKNKKLVIHIANEQQADLVTASAATLPHTDSEIELINKDITSDDEKRLTTVAFDGFELPRLAQCDIAYGCELYEVKELGSTPQTLLFVEVTHLYLNDNVVQLDDKRRIKVFADKVKPLARLGANEYAGITSPFKVNRPS